MSGHIAPLRVYLAVFVTLLVLTGVTTAVAFVDLGHANTPVALGIASVKASLVVLFFMHVRWSGRVVRTFAVVGLLFLVILFAFSLGDYLTRVPVTGWE
jgi:cytochrome c oxidase subunit 4